ncbi:unnamed protein product, partial [Dovyalis caffra]
MVREGTLTPRGIGETHSMANLEELFMHNSFDSFHGINQSEYGLWENRRSLRTRPITS